jgi:hypothetical protein
MKSFFILGGFLHVLRIFAVKIVSFKERILLGVSFGSR